MNLRDAVWTLLSEVATDGDRLLMGETLSNRHLEQTMGFFGRVHSILNRLTSPKSRLRAPALARELAALEADCSGPLEDFRLPLQRAIRRAEALVEKNRKANGSGSRAKVGAA